jgi:hypothetical protein
MIRRRKIVRRNAKVLFLLLLTVVLSATVFAGCDFLGNVIEGKDSTETNDDGFTATVGLSYELINDGTEYEVTKGKSKANGTVYIPEQHNGKPVTSIGDEAFYECSKLKVITIPDSVNNIGNSAFFRCSGLTEITIPNNVTRNAIARADR